MSARSRFVPAKLTLLSGCLAASMRDSRRWRVAEAIRGLGNGHGLGNGRSYSSVMESPDPEWHVAGLDRCHIHEDQR